MAKDTAEKQDATEQALDFDDVSPKALWARFKMVITEPNKFFEELPLDAGWKDPVVFMSALALINGLCLTAIRPKEGLLHIPIIIAWSFLGSGVLYQLSKRFFGGSGDYQGMYRAYAYAMAPMVIYWMPLMSLLAAGYAIFLIKLALVRSQEMEDRNAWVVIGIGVAAMVVIMIALAAYGMIVLFAAKSGANAIPGT
jgi:hypothetical protein